MKVTLNYHILVGRFTNLKRNVQISRIVELGGCLISNFQGKMLSEKNSYINYISFFFEKSETENGLTEQHANRYHHPPSKKFARRSLLSSWKFTCLNRSFVTMMSFTFIPPKKTSKKMFWMMINVQKWKVDMDLKWRCNVKRVERWTIKSAKTVWKTNCFIN